MPESLTRADKRGLMLVAVPALLGAVADLLLWRLAGPIAGAPRTYVGFLSWPQTIPAAARELIALGSRPFATLADAMGWRWRDSGFDWLAWLVSILFWLVFAALLTRVQAGLLRFCIRIGITRLLGAFVLNFSPYGLVAIPLLHLQWILLALATLVALALRTLRKPGARQR
jgi:hypothetical protein